MSVVDLPQAPNLLLTIGLQPNSAMSVLRGLASLGRNFEKVVLVHGPNQSRFAAKAVSDFVGDLQVQFPTNRNDCRNVQTIKLSEPFDSRVISHIYGTLVCERGAVDDSRLDEWIVVYGSGTVPMNVALVGPWLQRKDLWRNVWDYNEFSRRLTNANGDYFELGDHSRIPLTSLVAVRTKRSPTFAKRPNAGERVNSDLSVFASVISRMAGHSDVKLPDSVGPKLERVVEQLLERLVPTSLSIQRNLEIKFATDHLPNSSREIDILLESQTGRLLLVSCFAVTSQSRQDTAKRTQVRHKVNEIRQLATNYFGTETRTLTIFLAHLSKGKQPSQCPIIAGARFDAQITNHSAAKHWLISGHEQFGTSKKQYWETLNNPLRVDERVPGFSTWICD